MAITVQQLTEAGVPANLHQSIISLNAADVQATVDGNYVPKTKLEAALERAQGAESLLKERDSQITELGKFKGEAEKLQQKAEELTATNAEAKAEFEKQMAAKDKLIAVAGQLQLDNCVDPMEVAGKFDLDKISVDSTGKVGGNYDAQRDALKEAKAYYFAQQSTQPPASDKPAPAGSIPPGWQPVGKTPLAGSDPADKDVTPGKAAEQLVQSMIDSSKTSDNTTARAQAHFFGGGEQT